MSLTKKDKIVKHPGRKKKNIPISYFVEAVYGIKAKEANENNRF